MAFPPQIPQMPQPPQPPPQMMQGPGGNGASPPGQQPSPMGQGGPQMPPQGVQIPGMGGGSPDMDQDSQGPSEDALENYVNSAISDLNLVSKFKKKKNKKTNNDILTDMGAEIVKGYDIDEASRKNWMSKNDKWLKLATLVVEQRTFPWPRASNVKYPLLSTAAMQFSARAFPALVPSDGEIVKTKINKMNPNDQDYEAASRISAHMSYQIMNTIPNWEEDMDRLLMCMSITGICFKETFHDTVEGCHRSQFVLPQDLCVNYGAKSLEDAYRKTRILRFTTNECETKFRSGVFEKFDLPEPSFEPSKENIQVVNPDLPLPDKATPHLFIACHTFWDLDQDGYEEPYIITVHYKSKTVVRIIARWDMDGVKYDTKTKKLISIRPVEYFTCFPFIPNPDGSIYALGFGLLLGPLNESADSIINQLVDAGTLNNLQAGFIGKGLRIKIGLSSFQPGEWKVVNATGDDLSKSIFPLPTKEPSQTLLELLNLLITSGNQLASIAEIFVGKMPGQNTPATTTQETIQQGMAVFTAIYKRVYRSLAQEFRKLYRLNKINPDIVQEESKIAGVQLQASDYDLPDTVIIPGADPVGDSSTVKMAKLQQVGQLLNLQTINPQVYTMRVLQANEVPNPQELIAQPQPPQPDPVAQAKVQAIGAKSQADTQKAGLDAQAKQQDLDYKKQIADLNAQLLLQKQDFERQMQAMKLQGHQAEIHQNMVAAGAEQHMETVRQAHEIVTAEAKASQASRHAEEGHQVKMKIQKEQAAAKPKPKSNGKG